MWAWARLEAMKGRNSVYYYHFAHKPPFPKGSLYEGWGASYYAELWYMFDHLNQEPWRWRKSDRRLADVISSYWVNFAKSGNPNGAGLPPWAEFTPADNRVLCLNDPIYTDGVPNLKTLTVFDTVYAQVRGAPFGSR
jgi:para-nitrobenzyl esterase